MTGRGHHAAAHRGSVKTLTDEELFELAQDGETGALMRAYKELRDYHAAEAVERARLAIPLRQPKR